jgi:hypothetical protein
VTIAVLVMVAAVAGLAALVGDPARRDSPPAPENACVAYSGGRHTCPGG